ncbi:hypothetical protein ACS0TY_035279 [Phlomoides rotata]
MVPGKRIEPLTPYRRRRRRSLAVAARRIGGGDEKERWETSYGGQRLGASERGAEGEGEHGGRRRQRRKLNSYARLSATFREKGEKKNTHDFGHSKERAPTMSADGTISEHSPQFVPLNQASGKSRNYQTRFVMPSRNPGTTTPTKNEEMN